MSGLLDLLQSAYGNEASKWGNSPKLADLLRTAGNNPVNTRGMGSIRGLLDFVPGIGDAISAKDAIDQGRQGNYWSAALAGVGALPGIPGFTGHITDIKPPRWNAGRMSMPVGVEPTPGEIKELLRDDQSKSAYNTLRALLSKRDGSVMYAWPADAALHQDIGRHFNVNPSDVTHGLLTP